MKIEMKPIDDIRPYEANPRVIPEEAVARVASSINRYGYVAPIVVDRRGVVLAGHVRLQALRQLGYEEVPVVVSNLTGTKAKEYRILDNRLGENSEWDKGNLMLELREMDSHQAALHFPEVDLRLDYSAGRSLLNRDDIEMANPEPSMGGPRVTQMLHCPHCGHDFQIY